MKKQLERSQRLITIICSTLLSCFLSVSAFAQTFNPPGSFEDTHPNVGGGIGLTGHTSAYSLAWMNTALGPCDFVMSGWDDASALQPAGVSWRLLTPGNPAGIINQGVIPYANVRDVEVGAVTVNNLPQMLVAYYRNGIGHMVDVYDMATGAPVFLYTNVLSTMGYYTRISIDCHKQYGIVIAWEDMNGINFVCGLNTIPTITFSPILTLGGTLGETTVDVAFTHSSALLTQFVYYNPNTGNITESSFDYWVAMGLTFPQVVGPKIHDKNFIGTCDPCDPKNTPKDMPRLSVCPYMNIDAPGHYGKDNWAYTYTTDNNNISVRYMDLNTSPFAATAVVNDGSSLPAMPINGNLNVHPFLQYDNMCGPAINVAWYTNTIDPGPGSVAGYVGLRMNETGNVLYSPIDYLTVANNPTWGSMTPVISHSKSDDICPGFMYTVFPEFDMGAPGFRMENKYPAYCANSYKGDPNGDNHEHIACNDDERIAEFKKLHSIGNLSAYPNPFQSSFRIGLSEDYIQDVATITLIDVLGNTVATYNGPAYEANAYFETKTKNLAAGSYFLNVTIEGKLRETLKLTKSE
jgi:hypothetical protein